MPGFRWHLIISAGLSRQQSRVQAQLSPVSAAQIGFGDGSLRPRRLDFFHQRRLTCQITAIDPAAKDQLARCQFETRLDGQLPSIGRGAGMTLSQTLGFDALLRGDPAGHWRVKIAAPMHELRERSNGDACAHV